MPRRRRGARGRATARVHDPLWLLARQWQVGEFQGEDAGTPVVARWRARVAPLSRFHLGRDPGRTPSVQAAALRPRERAAGDAWSSASRAARRRRHAAPTAAPRRRRRPALPAAARRCSRCSKRYRDGVHRALRGADARRRRARAARRRDASRSPTSWPAAPSTRGACAPRSARRGVPGGSTRRSQIAPPTAPRSIEACRAGSTGATRCSASRRRRTRTRLAARAHGVRLLGRGPAVRRPLRRAHADGAASTTTARSTGTRFDLNARSTSAPTATAGRRGRDADRDPGAGELPRHAGAAVLGVEDARIDSALLQVGPTDLAHLLLIEYASGYGNDWFVMPIDLPVGSLTETTLARRHRHLRRAHAAAAARRPRRCRAAPWSMFQLATPVGTAARGRP